MLRSARSCRNCVEKCGHAIRSWAATPNLALPDSQHLPSECFEFVVFSAVSLHCGLPFSSPEVGITRRDYGAPLAVVGMPEAAVHKNRYPASREQEIRLSRQLSRVKAITKSPCVKCATQLHLGPCIDRSDSAHVEASLRGRMNVDHSTTVIRCWPSANRALSRCAPSGCHTQNRGFLLLVGGDCTALLVPPAIVSRGRTARQVLPDRGTQWR